MDDRARVKLSNMLKLTCRQNIFDEVLIFRTHLKHKRKQQLYLIQIKFFIVCDINVTLKNKVEFKLGGAFSLFVASELWNRERLN